MLKKEFEFIQHLCGQKFTVDGCCDNRGVNSLCTKYYSPKRSFLRASLAGEHVWLNPPFVELREFLRHYVAEKAKSPTTTSACIVVPKVAGRRWRYLLQNMELIHEYPVGSLLFSAPTSDGLSRRALPGIPWPVQIYYDAKTECVKIPEPRVYADQFLNELSTELFNSGTAAGSALEPPGPPRVPPLDRRTERNTLKQLPDTVSIRSGEPDARFSTASDSMPTDGTLTDPQNRVTGLTLQFAGSLAGRPVKILIDTGADSFNCLGFVSNAFIQRERIACKKAAAQLKSILFPDGSSSEITGQCKLQLKLQTYHCSLPLLVTELDNGFDLILSDQWLQHHEAYLDYKLRHCVILKGKRRMTLKCPNLAPVSNETPKPLSELISAMQVKRALRKGHRCHWVDVRELVENDPQINSITQPIPEEGLVQPCLLA